MTHAIITNKLSKNYGNKVALKDLDIHVNRGEIFGFLGENGSGKTTTIRILSTIVKPSSGAAIVNGYDIIKEDFEVRKSISGISQSFALNHSLNVYDNIYTHLLLKGLSIKVAKKQTEIVLGEYGLEKYKKSKIGELSGGFKKRVEIARTLVGNSEIIFLDEPSVGLDPKSRKFLWGKILEANNNGKTIFLTTQYLHEADTLCDRVCFMKAGESLGLYNMEELSKKFSEDKLIFTVDVNFTNSIDSTLDKEDVFYHNIVNKSNVNYFVRFKNEDNKIIQLLNKLKDFELKDISIEKTNLEDIYFDVMGE